MDVTQNVDIKCKPCGCYYRPLIENCLLAVASASLLHEVFLELREKIAIKGCVNHLIQSVDLGSILGKRNKYAIFVRPSHPFQWRIGQRCRIDSCSAPSSVVDNLSNFQLSAQ